MLVNLRRLFLQDNKISILPESIVECPLTAKHSVCLLTKNGLVDYLGKPYKQSGIKGVFEVMIANGILEAHKQFFSREEQKLATTFLDGRTKTLVKNKHKQKKFQDSLVKLRTQSRDTITRYNSTSRHGTMRKSGSESQSNLDSKTATIPRRNSNSDEDEDETKNENSDGQTENDETRSRTSSFASARSVRRVTSGTLQRQATNDSIPSTRSSLGSPVQQYPTMSPMMNTNPMMGNNMPMMGTGVPMMNTPMPMMVVQSVYDPATKQMKYLFPGPDGKLMLVGMNQTTQNENDSDEEYVNFEIDEEDEGDHLEFNNLFQALPDDVQDKFEAPSSFDNLAQTVDMNRVSPAIAQEKFKSKNTSYDYRFKEDQTRNELIPVLNPNDRKNIRTNLEQSLFKNEEPAKPKVVKRISLTDRTPTQSAYASLDRKGGQAMMNAYKGGAIPPPPSNMPGPPPTPATPKFQDTRKSSPMPAPQMPAFPKIEQDTRKSTPLQSSMKPLMSAPSMGFQEPPKPSARPTPPSFQKPQLPAAFQQSQGPLTTSSAPMPRPKSFIPPPSMPPPAIFGNSGGFVPPPPAFDNFPDAVPDIPNFSPNPSPPSFNSAFDRVKDSEPGSSNSYNKKKAPQPPKPSPPPFAPPPFTHVPSSYSPPSNSPPSFLAPMPTNLPPLPDQQFMSSTYDKRYAVGPPTDQAPTMSGDDLEKMLNDLNDLVLNPLRQK